MREINGQIFLDIKAAPGSSRSRLSGIREGRLTVKIAAAAEDGRANAGLIAFFAGALGCAKKEITIKSGERSRLKTLAFPSGMKERLRALIESMP
jgi:uncharacterized protein (TIGR00251 family)